MFTNNTACNRILGCIISFHVFIIALSNYLVQFPFQIFNLHNTWGAFSFPFVYLATDLTVRIYGRQMARKIIMISMVPALFISYFITVLFEQGHYQGMSQLSEFDVFAFRIAFASFMAYCLGQIMDIVVFAKLRRTEKWWVAPTSSNVVAAFFDTLIFFSIAFFQSSDAYMAEFWPTIAFSDYGFKLLIGLIFFIPAYGAFLKLLSNIIAPNRQQNFVVN
ncbi:MAG: 7-cyano-7-deazaguanine/7-aminomethyl-7-deazaguanine transporter [Shewanellaceae bacterium]|nr:7-cyano-7-deazaguanine/7-aminomethyl-7-deazaguanine transporter [Shewanellaceae bacterium]